MNTSYSISFFEINFYLLFLKIYLKLFNYKYFLSSKKIIILLKKVGKCRKCGCESFFWNPGQAIQKLFQEIQFNIKLSLWGLE